MREFKDLEAIYQSCYILYLSSLHVLNLFSGKRQNTSARSKCQMVNIYYHIFPF